VPCRVFRQGTDSALVGLDVQFRSAQELEC
jgi:hypothetical protein